MTQKQRENIYEYLKEYYQTSIDIKKDIKKTMKFSVSHIMVFLILFNISGCIFFFYLITFLVAKTIRVNKINEHKITKNKLIKKITKELCNLEINDIELSEEIDMIHIINFLKKYGNNVKILNSITINESIMYSFYATSENTDNIEFDGIDDGLKGIILMTKKPFDKTSFNGVLKLNDEVYLIPNAGFVLYEDEIGSVKDAENEDDEYEIELRIIEDMDLIEYRMELLNKLLNMIQ